MWDDLDRVLAEGYLSDVPAMATAEIKARRAECRDVEAKVSYLRRLIQGRLDIVSAEIRRRESGAPPGDLSDLVEQLPMILADRVHAPGPGRMPTNLVPPDDADLTAELDAVSGPNALGSLPDTGLDELRDIAATLQAMEQRVSGHRRAVFEVIDTLQAELADRYGEREASG